MAVSTWWIPGTTVFSASPAASAAACRDARVLEVVEETVLRPDQQVRHLVCIQVDQRRAGGVAGDWPLAEGTAVDEHVLAVFLPDVLQQVGVAAVDQQVQVTVAVPVTDRQLAAPASAGTAGVKLDRLSIRIDEDSLRRKEG